MGDFIEGVPEILQDMEPESLLEITEMPILVAPLLFDSYDEYKIICRNYELYNYTNYIHADLTDVIVQPDIQFDVVIVNYANYAGKSSSRLYTNAYNFLKSGGLMIIIGEYYQYLNASVLTNWCALGSLVQHQFMTDYFALFDMLDYVESDLEEQPAIEMDYEDPRWKKEYYCWKWNDEDDYHPQHKLKKFLFVGRK